MDPITRAATSFRAQAEGFWEEAPGRALRMVAEPPYRGDVVKALRLAELAPENRRPFFLYEAPFAGQEPYFAGLARSIAEDYERVRRGAAEEGVALGAFGALPALRRPIDQAVLAAERAAALLEGRLDGVLVALVPRRVERPDRFRDAVQAWTDAPRSERVRLAVWDVPGGPLEGRMGAGGACFSVDPNALFDFLEPMPGPGASAIAGDGPPAPAVAPAEVGRALRAWILSAARASVHGDHRGAAEHYRAARGLCQAEGLAREDAMVLLSQGGACVAAGAAPQAVESFLAAAERGHHAEAWPLAAHAWLAAGALYAMQRRRDLAARAYEAAASAAERGELPALRDEAHRKASACR